MNFICLIRLICCEYFPALKSRAIIPNYEFRVFSMHSRAGGNPVGTEQCSVPTKKTDNVGAVIAAALETIFMLGGAPQAHEGLVYSRRYFL
ncbi:MAG: hypothetical protein H8E87_00420 [FCB group bacterium]|nr:hypothetical protein [FCB group bacterium]